MDKPTMVHPQGEILLSNKEQAIYNHDVDSNHYAEIRQGEIKTLHFLVHLYKRDSNLEWQEAARQLPEDVGGERAGL